MIGTALGLELRTLLRSPLRLLVLALVLGSGLFVIVQGQRDVARWGASIEAGRELQEESLAEAREYLASEELGPEDKPWIDLSQPRWQDWFAATRLAREPAPLAGMAFASAETGAVSVRLNRFANPLLAQGTKIENPALAAAGGLDLVTVLTLLLPLMILALGIEIGGYERAAGILPLVQVQSGQDRSWISARCVAVGLVAGTTGLVLGLAACVAGGAGGLDALLLGLFVLAYVTVWTALLTVVALVARQPSQGAVVLGSAWIVLCVLLPAVGVERSAALAADDFAVDLTVEARDTRSQLSELEDDEVLAALLVRFPELATSVPQDEEKNGAREARDGLRLVAVEERLRERERLGRAQARCVGLMSLASPAVAMTHALERLAGRGPEAAWAFRGAVADAAAGRMERYIRASWEAEALDARDFEELVASYPTRVAARRGPGWEDLSFLVAWAAALTAVAGLLSPRRRSESSARDARPLVSARSDSHAT